MLDRCVDAILMFWNRVDAFFGWPENPTRRSEQYWHRVNCHDDGCGENETLVWGTVIRKLRAPGKQGNLAIFVPPRTPFVQDDMGVAKYELQRILTPGSGPGCYSTACQVMSGGNVKHESTTTRKPKAPGKLGMLRIIVPTIEPFVQEARYANEYYKLDKVADKALRQAVKRTLPPITPLEALLPPADSLHLDCEDEDELLMGTHHDSQRGETDSCRTDSIPCSGTPLEAQANDIWLDIYSQEADQKRVVKSQAETGPNVCVVAANGAANVVYCGNDSSAMPSGFWDQM